MFPPGIAAPSQGQTQGPYDSIGGWLIFVAIGLTLFFIRGVIVILMYYVPLFTGKEPLLWLSILFPWSPYYQPGIVPAVVDEMVVNVALIIFAAVNLKFMLNRSKRFPMMLVALLLANVTFVAIDLWLTHKLLGSVEYFTFEIIGQVLVCIAAAAIGVPYFLMSKRVKETFVT